MPGAVGHDSALSERYAIERELGRGGMGVVFLARDLRHDRPVAIKFLPAELASTIGAARFDQEIQTLAKLTHPHILPLHDSGDANGELYFVMPHVVGESLRERLDREGPMRVHAALQIVRQVADALAYAHAAGVVHRDIKPENILLDHRGHAWVSDFGIARVLQASVEGSRFTSAVTRIGSPPYMSPEQIAGEPRLDGRSDLYSLGCVLFEMLARQPPFADHRPQVIMRRHLVDPAPLLRHRRADVGPGLDRIVASLLAKQPEERCPNADALVVALDAELARLTSDERKPQLIAPRPSQPGRRRIVLATAVALTLFAAAWVAHATASGGGLFNAPSTDPHRLVVLPLRWSDGSEPSTDHPEDLLLYAAFDRWTDLDLITRPMVEEAVERHGGPAAISASIGFDVARGLGAGRLVHGIATRMADSVRLDLALSSADGTPVARISTRVPLGPSAHSAYSLAVDSLLFGRVSWDDGPEWNIGTSSAAARTAYGAAHEALESWDLERADKLLRDAISHDRNFARATLWLAQLQAWLGHAPEAWRPAARLAQARRDELTERESRLAEGLVALGEGRHPDACQAYSSLLQSNARDAGAWFGFAECHIRDNHVVRDARSPSGWRYRASYGRGVEALRRAFELEPGSHVAFRRDAFARLSDDILYTRLNRRRSGISESGLLFYARPQWYADSLQFIPYPANAVSVPARDLDGIDEALARHRLLFREVARGWSIAYPNTVDALHAVAMALELQGDEAALDTLVLARELATERSEQLDLAIQEVWLRVKLGGPHGVSLERARVLADSVLAAPEAAAPSLARKLAPLAVLLGRPALGALHARRDPLAVVGTRLPNALTAPAAALLVFAAVGVPADSIGRLERQTEAAIRNTVPAAERSAARQTLLERAAILSYPTFAFPVLHEPGILQAPLARAQAALEKADTATVRRYVAMFRELGGTPDMAYPAAALAVAVGDTLIAVAILDAALDDMQWLHPGIIAHVAHAGGLVRAIALRADLAAAAGEPTATRWARTVIDLWQDGEPSVAPTLARMRALVAS